MARLLRWFQRKPRPPRCPYGCNDELYVNERGSCFRTTRSVMFKGRCPIHKKVAP